MSYKEAIDCLYRVYGIASEEVKQALDIAINLMEAGDEVKRTMEILKNLIDKKAPTVMAINDDGEVCGLDQIR